MTKLTKGERIARERLFKHLDRLDSDTPDWGRIEREAPQAWHMILVDLDVEEPKVKVTLYLDRSVAQVFRAMGPGWQARANRVLATWCALHIGGLLKFREEFPKRMHALMDDERARRERGEETGGFGVGTGRR